jgi:protein ImuB
MNSLYACVHVREFPLQAMQRMRPAITGEALAVLEGEPPMEQVCSLNRIAHAMGVERGMTKLDLEMFPAAHVLPRAHGEESAARDALLQCAGAFSPRIEEQSGDYTFACIIDITGTGTLFGTPEALGASLLEKIVALGIQASIAICSNFHAARCLARGHSSDEIFFAARGTEAKALSCLPLSVLDLSEEHAETFAAWGISTLGELGSLAETELITRLGQSGKELRLLARGEATHLFTPIEQIFSLEEQMELDSPVELLDSLLFVLGAMLDQLIVRAQASILAIAEVTLTLTLEGGALHVRTVRPALPNIDRKLWLKLIHLDLESHPPQAAILALHVHAIPGSTSNVQLGLFSPQVPESLRLDVTLARIRSIVGEGYVGQAVLNDSHRPDSFHVEPFTVPETVAGEPRPLSGRVALRQIRPPESVTVTLDSQQPDSLIFRNRKYIVEHAYGPWSSSGDWWNPTLWSLEQWDLVARTKDASIPATWLCCCLTRDLVENRWQLDAIYD